MRRARTSRHRSLRAVRRDITVLVVAAAASISLGTWLHAQQCSHDEPVQIVCSQDCAPPPPPVAAPIADPGCEEVETVEPPQVEPPPPPPQPRALEYGDAFSFVIQLDRPYVVLSTRVDPAWAKGKPSLDEDVNAWREVDVDALPSALREAEGRELALYERGSADVPQTTHNPTIGAPRLLARAAGELYFGDELIIDTWELHEQIEAGGLPRRRANAAAKALWAEGEKLLVAPLEGDVPKAVAKSAWTRSTSLPPPTFYSRTALPSEDATSLETQLLATSDGAHAAEDFTRFEDGPLSGWLSTTGWASPDGTLALTTTFVDSPQVGICGAFDLPVSNAAHVHAGVIGTPHNLPISHSGGPAFVADLNVDGYPDIVVAGEELASSDVLLAGGPNGHVVVDSLAATPYFGCPC